jgi:hypothetical protein
MESKALTSEFRDQAVFVRAVVVVVLTEQRLVSASALACRKPDPGQTFEITFDYQTGGLPFYDGKRS